MALGELLSLEPLYQKRSHWNGRELQLKLKKCFGMYTSPVDFLITQNLTITFSLLTLLITPFSNSLHRKEI